MAAKNKGQNIVVWVLMGLLVIGLAGFGVDGFLSQRVTSIGTVGTREIAADTYARTLQDTMRRAEQIEGQPMTLARAQAAGLDAQVRAQMVTQAALEAEAERIGISVSDANVMRTVTAIDAFRGPGGAFDRDMYRFQLENAGLTPARFEEDVRREAARGILQAATAAGVAVPANLNSAILDHFATPRDVTVFVLDEGALETPLAEPDAAAVEAFHAANIARFTAPEVRAISYAWVTPDMLLDAVPVDEAALRAAYDQRIDEFRQPERRLVERLVFPDAASAEAAMAAYRAGTSFEDLVAGRGLSLDDTDMGDVTRAQLGEAGEAVFALTEPGSVTGPHRSTLGPAIFRMNAVLSAQETTFDEASEGLRAELAADGARRRIAEAFDDLEDLLAGGASLAELAEASDLVLGRIDWSDEVFDGIAGYAEFRSAARAARPDDFPQIVTLSDGGLFALQLDAITPPAPRPLDSVRDEAAAGARQAALEAALSARAEALAPDLVALGEEAFAEQTGLVADSFVRVTRLDRMPGLPPALVTQIHAAGPGETLVQAAGGLAWLALVSAVDVPDTGDEQTRRLIEAIDAEIGGALAQDVFAYFARALEREAGFRFNQAAIDAVHATLR